MPTPGMKVIKNIWIFVTNQACPEKCRKRFRSSNSTTGLAPAAKVEKKGVRNKEATDTLKRVLHTVARSKLCM